MLPALWLWGKHAAVATVEGSMEKIADALRRLVVLYKDQEGQALAEYGLILGLIAVVAIAGLTLLGGAISGKLDAVNTALGGSGSA
jgi:pilus assembly protein Flp/PilA